MERLRGAAKQKKEEEIALLCEFGLKKGWLNNEQITMAYQALSVKRDFDQEPKDPFGDALDHGLRTTTKP